MLEAICYSNLFHITLKTVLIINFYCAMRCIVFSEYCASFLLLMFYFVYSKETPSSDTNWDASRDSCDTSPHFSASARRSQEETEAANMLSKYFLNQLSPLRTTICLFY